jgi:phosphate transport system protein
MTQLEASLQHDMDLIRSTVQEMSAQCERALRGALAALVDGGRQGAYLVVLRDQQIDELEQQLDRLCLEYLVRQQPAAGHLRFAYAAIKISTALERIGDHAEAMARRILRLDPARSAASVATLIGMGETSVGMLSDAIRAFITSDAELARRTMPIERVVDDQLRAIERNLEGEESAGQLTPKASGLLAAISRRIERVSDEVRDICADTLYMCTGDYVKHTSPEAFRILFVDQHNHCRSQMAEAISATLAHPRLLFSSAGLDPRPIDPRLSPFLHEKGLEIVRHRAKSIDQIPNLEHYYVVVSFDENAYYALRFRRTPTVCIDWPVDDPSLLPGTLEETRGAYEAAFSAISEQLRDLVEAVVRQEKK